MDESRRPLSDVEFVAFDLETTGLFPVACRIVEFGALRFRLDGKELGCLDQLVDPECLIPPKVTKIHGIKDAMVRGKPTVGEIMPKFLEFLGGPATILLAHNASFDMGFLAFAMAKRGIPLPSHRVVDTLDLARSSLRGLPAYSLETIARRLGVADWEDHRALSDSRLVMGVFQNMIGRNPRLRTVGDLFRLSAPMDFRHIGVAAVEPPVGYEDLTLAIVEERALVMVYEGGTKGVQQRKVTPRALLNTRGHIYLAAFCHIDNTEKSFRLDRIREFHIEEQ